MSRQPLIIICGPTGTGKTDLAIKLCQKFSGEIISADSRQVYKYADVGVNKLNVKSAKLKVEIKNGGWIQDGVKIHLYDVIEPDEVFSVAEFVEGAGQALDDIIGRSKIPFLVGGTGFYLHAFLGEAPYSTVRRDEKLRSQLDSCTAAQLYSRLQGHDKKFAESLNASDRGNKRRLIRYIELAKSAGSVSGATVDKHCNSAIYLPRQLAGCAPSRNPSRNPSRRTCLAGLRRAQSSRRRVNSATTPHLKIGLTAPREHLYHKADKWTNQIVQHGLIEETQWLINQYSEKIPLLKGLIYSPVVAFINSQITRDEMVERIQFQLHAYIRRQLTWFKRDAGIKWFDIRKRDAWEGEVEKIMESLLMR
ncbi:tRNA (adenosine(37)-N6)-dimethylallyltransferase MiaA [Patescibacteria group bacterium]|nr:tRNA (adenosine(37)-N6)-dimethylallyltransferase MiaA [Patescibacteria group bacterium]